MRVNPPEDAVPVFSDEMTRKYVEVVAEGVVGTRIGIMQVDTNVWAVLRADMPMKHTMGKSPMLGAGPTPMDAAFSVIERNLEEYKDGEEEKQEEAAQA